MEFRIVFPPDPNAPLPAPKVIFPFAVDILISADPDAKFIIPTPVFTDKPPAPQFIVIAPAPVASVIPPAKAVRLISPAPAVMGIAPTNAESVIGASDSGSVETTSRPLKVGSVVNLLQFPKSRPGFVSATKTGV